MRGEFARLRLGPLLVAAGALSIPVAQWVIFALVARYDGAAMAGAYGLLYSVGTAVHIFTNFGLTDTYITLHARHRYISYLVLRTAGVVLASACIVAFGAFTKVSVWLILLVIIQKSADSLVDIVFAWLQRGRRLAVYGSVMLVNGLVTTSLAVITAIVYRSSVAIVGASAIGSGVALVFAVVCLWRPSLTYLKSEGLLGLRPDYGHLIAIVRASVPIAGLHVIGVAIMSAPIWGISVFATTEEVGRFVAVSYLLTAGSLIGSILNSIFIGEYQALYSSRGADSMIAAARRSAIISSVVGLVSVIGIVCFGNSVFQAVYGHDFRYSSLELAVVGVAAALNPGSQIIAAGALVLNSYNAQMRIWAWALAIVVIYIAIGAMLHSPAVLIGCSSALIGSLVKYVVSFFQLSLGKSGR